MDEERQRDASQVAYGELPELTRTTRALGSQRTSGASPAVGSMQAAFFQPLLEARRRAADARNAEERVHAFDPRDLSRHLDRAVERIVDDWPDTRTSTRRAVRAQLVERVSGYTGALSLLAQRARELLEADEPSQLQAWRDWTRQLVAVFEAADRCWISLQSAASAIPPRP
jgi:hypothetical protein